MMDHGATTLWEHWEHKQCLNVHSNCHPMFGSFEQWFVRHVLGIAVCADAVGCDKVRIRPNAVCGLDWARGHLDTPKGRISVSWKMDAGRMVVEKSIPPGIEVVE
jgi:alpha-L-rhamnosidase